MDHFGIGNAMRSLFHTLQMHSRGTGRTTSLINSIGDNDRVVVASSHEADRLRYECQKHCKNPEIVVVSPRSPGELLKRKPCEGRTLFEHIWVEQFYELAIERVGQDIDELQRRTSNGQPVPEIFSPKFRFIPE